MTRNHKVGDRILIRKDLSLRQIYVIPSMLQYKGRIATITEIYDYNSYYIDLDENYEDGRHFWVDKHFDEKFTDDYIKYNILSD